MRTFPLSWLPLSGHKPLLWNPLSLLCLYLLPYLIRRRSLYLFLEVWGLLLLFRSCSVGVVPHSDEFLMYLWGGRWSLSLTPPPSSVSWFYFKMQQAHLSVSFLQRCREIYYTLRDLLHEIGLCIIGAGSVHFSSVQLLSRVRFFVTPWTAAHQSSLSITSSWSLTKLMSTELVIPFNHLILCCPFSSHLQSFPESGSFQMSLLLAKDLHF